MSESGGLPDIFATMRKPGKDNSGEKVYVKKADGSPLEDSHNHPIVDHDLYNHEGLTEDGIAEVFREFACREGLSFFVGARFDELRYIALTGGLEISEVALSGVVASGRLGAEYYSEKAIAVEQFIMQKPHMFLKANEVVSGPFGSTLKSSSYMTEGDIPFVRIENLRGGFHISRDNLVYISHADNLRLTNSQLRTDDLILSKVGSIGFFARVDDELGTCNISENNIGLKLSAYSTREKHVMLVYLNSKYGQASLQRRKSGNVQPKLNVKDVCFIPIPKFGDDFSERISTLIIESDKALHESTALYANAQALLSAHLGQVPHDTRNTSIRSLSEVFSTAQLDAEYFMPNYDGLLATIHSYKDGCESIGSLFRQITTKCPRTESSYRYVEISDVDVGTGSAKPNDISTPDLPDNAKIMTQKGDILVSKVRPNRGAVAILEDDGLLVSGAFTVLREATNYKREVLQVLLRNEIYRDLLLRFNVGTSYPVIKDEDILNLPVPLFDNDTQHTIALNVQRSFSLRNQADSLIASAVKAVELAVESSEQSAINFITKENLS